MKAIVVEGYGGAEALTFADVPMPEPGDGEALVKLAYAGVNFIDVYIRSGLYARSDTYAQTPPMVIGMEGAGEVAALGPGAGDLGEGDRVAYCLSLGSYAEYATVPAWKLVKVPHEVPLDIAAALQLQGSTAHYLTQSLFALGPGHWCLVHAGAGGVGQLVIQLAKARGATVIATVGGADKAGIARARGADHVIDYRQDDFVAAVGEITGGKGVDVVYDSVGKDTIKGSLKCLKPRGVLSNNGASSGAVTAIDPMDLAEAGSVFFTRPHLADYIADADERNLRAGDLFRLWREGSLTVTIDRELPLSAAARAHRAIEGRQTKGKLLLRIGD
ncbi:MAG: quinone oxidoreductase [Proteobacteria bacterium]|nr:quinone oxidoreductase [Pseudomonadota bacterium]